ncbi:MAG: hypothetical protein IAE82_00850 [Opitutaceae bacterium]|nr:hypothetical protein [Opitutaceae bacterium]
MPYIIGVVLAAAVGVFAWVVGLDRDRAFYPTVMIVIAFLYGLFAAIDGSTTTILVECVVGTGFAAAAVAGFKRSLWVVVAALAAHGIFDSFHGHVIPNRGVPLWWPEFCLAYDVAAAVFLAVILSMDRRAGSPAQP